MIKKIFKKLFGMTEAQERTYNLVADALQKGDYRIHKNEFFYDDGRHHSLSVTVRLTATVQVSLHTLFATTDLLVSNPQDREPKGQWNEEISCGKTHKMIRKYFENILIQAEQAEQNQRDSHIKDATQRILKGI